MYTQEEVRLIRDRIEESVCQIESMSMLVNSILDRVIRVIALVKPRAVCDPGSFSTGPLIGKMFLANLHSNDSKGWRVGNIVDALVHETIHSLIYMIELFAPLCTDQRKALSHFGVSPWSGRTLDLHSLLHACFVWFGLWNFWNLDFSTNRSPGNLASGRRAASPVVIQPQCFRPKRNCAWSLPHSN